MKRLPGLNILAILLLSVTSLCAQNVPRVTITGRVVDDSTSAPLQNVDVFIAHTTLGSGTDQNGQFTIPNVPAGSYEIVASRVGYVFAIVRMTVSDSGNTGILIRLKPSLVEVGEVVVTASEDNQWRVQLKKFIPLFLGKSENATGCTILNPEVLDFESGDNNLFVATARAPLEIDNRSLGYHVRFILTQFRVGGTDFPYPTLQQFSLGKTTEMLQVRGFSQYTELNPNGSDEVQTWRKNRQKAYLGSLRHFLSSLFRKEASENGFMLYREPRVTTSEWNTLRRGVKEDDILFEDAQQHERVLRFNGILEIEYTRALRDPHYDLLEKEATCDQVSWLGLNRDSVTIDSRGLIREQFFPIVTHGYWAWQRMADALPLDYEPDVLASSDKDTHPVTPSTTSSQIIPLAVGNQWTMRITEWGADGDATSVKKEIIEVLRDSTVAGERWFVMRSYGGRLILCMNKPDGLYELRSGKSTLWLKYPANVNDSYQSPDANSNRRIVSVNLNVSVPKGTFVCYQYESSFMPLGGFKTNTFYSPGVGCVAGELARSNRNLTGASITGKIELVDYVLH